MKLKDLFDHLAFSELSQLVGIDSNTGLIEEKSYDKVLTAINLGLTALHSRFLIKECELTVSLLTGKYTYPLHSQYAVSKGGAVSYIQDSVTAPFKDDILKMESVRTADGTDLPLNDHSNKYSLHTPTLYTLNVPKDIVDSGVDVPSVYVTNTLILTYRANHKIMPIGYNGYNADLVEVELPYNFVEPLLYFVGSRLHNPMGLVNDFNAGNNYASKYERACAEIERSNVRVDQDSQNSRFVNNGWI